MQRTRAPISIRSGQIEFLKLNIERWQWRDAYQWLHGLSWPQFSPAAAPTVAGESVLVADYQDTVWAIAATFCGDRAD